MSAKFEKIDRDIVTLRGSAKQPVASHVRKVALALIVKASRSRVAHINAAFRDTLVGHYQVTEPQFRAALKRLQQWPEGRPLIDSVIDNPGEALKIKLRPMPEGGQWVAGHHTLLNSKLAFWQKLVLLGIRASFRSGKSQDRAERFTLNATGHKFGTPLVNFAPKHRRGGRKHQVRTIQAFVRAMKEAGVIYDVSGCPAAGQGPLLVSLRDDEQARVELLARLTVATRSVRAWLLARQHCGHSLAKTVATRSADCGHSLAGDCGHTQLGHTGVSSVEDAGGDSFLTALCAPLKDRTHPASPAELAQPAPPVEQVGQLAGGGFSSPEQEAASPASSQTEPAVFDRQTATQSQPAVGQTAMTALQALAAALQATAAGQSDPAGSAATVTAQSHLPSPAAPSALDAGSAGPEASSAVTQSQAASVSKETASSASASKYDPDRYRQQIKQAKSPFRAETAAAVAAVAPEMRQRFEQLVSNCENGLLTWNNGLRTPMKSKAAQEDMVGRLCKHYAAGHIHPLWTEKDFSYAFEHSEVKDLKDQSLGNILFGTGKLKGDFWPRFRSCLNKHIKQRCEFLDQLDIETQSRLQGLEALEADTRYRAAYGLLPQPAQTELALPVLVALLADPTVAASAAEAIRCWAMGAHGKPGSDQVRLTALGLLEQAKAGGAFAAGAADELDWALQTLRKPLPVPVVEEDEEDEEALVTVVA